MALISAHDLWKFYGERAVVSGLTFSIKAGEILGILGPNGAGKTTTVGMLYGLIQPTKGRIIVGSFDSVKNEREARRLIGTVTQEDNLDIGFSVYENLLLFAHHFRITGSEAEERIEQLLADVGLSKYKYFNIEQLSGGLQRRLALARALINKPQIIFLDEPTTGLDPDARQEFWKLVDNLRLAGCAVLLTTHYMDEAERLCDRILLLKNGAKIDEGHPLELIARIVGETVCEIDGLASNILADTVRKYSTWSRPLGSGFLIGVRPEMQHNLLSDLGEHLLKKITLRKADLQDAYLFLTGNELQ